MTKREANKLDSLIAWWAKLPNIAPDRKKLSRPGMVRILIESAKERDLETWAPADALRWTASQSEKKDAKNNRATDRAQRRRRK